MLYCIINFGVVVGGTHVLIGGASNFSDGGGGNYSINVQEINSPPPDFFWLAIIKNYSMKNYMLQKCQINDNFAACNRIELFLEIGSQK